MKAVQARAAACPPNGLDLKWLWRRMLQLFFLLLLQVVVVVVVAVAVAVYIILLNIIYNYAFHLPASKKNIHRRKERLNIH